MPKTETDYSKTIIYKLCCNDVDIKECYVGHTTNFVKRKYQHKNNCDKQTKKHNYYVYQFIRENGCFENWSMVQVEEFNAENRLQAETRERYWIETLQSKLNKIIPTRSKKEYYDTHKEEIAEYKKEYYEEHKEELAEKKKEYYNVNKEKFAEKKKTKYTCECGSFRTIGNKVRHERSKKHLAFLKLTEN